MNYTELQVTTNFSFLRGGSHPEELVEQASRLGYTAIGITDHNTLAGIVRAHAAARTQGIRVIPGCCLNLEDGPPLLAYPTDKAAYARLSGLLTLGNLRTEKGQCLLYRKDVYAHAEGILFIALPPAQLNEKWDFEPDFKNALQAYRRAFGAALYLAGSWSYRGFDAKRLYRTQQLCTELDIPMVAVNDVYYHDPARRELQDMLTCIREKCTISGAGYRLCQNAERFLKPFSEMQRLFRLYPDAIQCTQEIASACRFSLDELEYVYPEEITTEGRTPQEELCHLTWQGARERFGEPVPENIQQSILFELDFIARKNYAAYFLTVHDFVRFARSRDILCQGRGSAANSVVCYCLGITSVSPAKFKLLFARFMSDARDEPPDIDVDFEHERREEVMQYIYQKYGRDRAGIVATVTQVHYKGAVRDVAKAMGLSVDTVNRLAACGGFHGEGVEEERIRQNGLDIHDPLLRKALELTKQYIGFPRQLGQHTGGFVITRGKLSDLCPVLNARMEDRTNIEWNKDDIEALGFLKVDVLALGMLTCIRKCFDLAGQHHGLALTLANIPEDDPAVYEMISHADTIGVFQIESRAQMSMLPRLRPKCFYDLVIEVAIVRPGPIQGDMVHPYLRRRNGEEPVEFPSQELRDILGRTLGVPLFQEQAMEIAIVAAGFTPDEADGLRRSMATFKAKGKVAEYEKKLISGMVSRGYTEEYARRVFRQIEGFGSYGFPESHAVSFALLAYVSSWLKCYYPDVFACALLNSQPMGFYQPAQLISDARRHGVEVLPVDVNHSFWECTLEERNGNHCPLRLGFAQVKGLSAGDAALLVSGRKKGYATLTALREAGVPPEALERLADADAFRSLGLDRRQALWEVTALGDRPVGLFEGQPAVSADEEKVTLPAMSLSEHVLQDYGATGLSLKAHPVHFVRRELSRQKATPTAELNLWPDGTIVRVAGIVLVRQRPGTAGGTCFITIEDETGSANLIAFPKLLEKFRKEILYSRLLMVEGRLQREGEITHVLIKSCYNLTGLLDRLLPGEDEAFPPGALEPDQEKIKRPQAIQGEMFPSRNFK
ncbi:error-prone DNA polymerase [Compostibacter hankyongensis]|uniref:Error-prone DNA polymerase n=1 Tax=Compostibacter hankyongensis TaxID=1007089 RepID=A0ABP8FBC9_9BACT